MPQAPPPLTLEQAHEAVFSGHGLPQRWRGRAMFTVVELGFGLGSRFLATWAAWRDDAQRCERLHFVAFEKQPPSRADLTRAWATAPLARELIAAWPVLTPNFHHLGLDGGRVQLLLGFGDAARMARQLVASADAFFLDAAATAADDGAHRAALFKSLARLAAPDATLAAASAAPSARGTLRTAGFELRAAGPPPDLGAITHARYAPRFKPVAPPGRVVPQRAPSDAIVVGGGLAGAATARALARQGVRCTVLDVDAQPASQASGNPAGLFHGTVGADDSRHTRWHRAASNVAAQWVRDSGAGVADGLLRLNAKLGLASMRALLAAQRLPGDYVQALDSAQASARAGLALTQPAWWFAQGGWADPAALVRHALAAPGVTWRGGVGVHAIARVGTHWQALDGQARVIASAPLLVLANAHDALRLAGLPSSWAERVRGQVTWLEAGHARLAPRVPIASGGYALALPDGRLLVGATQQPGDDDARVREADHADNLDRAQALLGGAVVHDGAVLHGRVGWRVVTRDRLPLVGMAPDLAAPLPPRRDAPRLFARRAGLFLHTALGSRGITTAALGGELIAAQAVGAPWPLEADLVDAIDPARLL